MFALKPPVAGFPHGFLPRQQQLQHFESQLREAQRQVAQRQRGRRGWLDSMDWLGIYGILWLIYGQSMVNLWLIYG